MIDGRADGSRVRTVFIGSGGFGVEALRRLAETTEIALVGVVTAPARPAGRRQELTPTDIDTTAQALGIWPILTPERLRSPDAVASVLALSPELVVLADYGQLVPQALLDLPHGALNVHPSLLPRHRGATPIPAAILAGDHETGVTLMRMDAGLDTGSIVRQRPTALNGGETTPELEARLAAIAAQLLAETVGPWLRGTIEATPQPEDGSSLTRPLRREDGRLDPRQPAAVLERQVRAYQPWPGSFLETTAGRLTVWSAAVGPSERLPAGRVTGDGITTNDGLLRLGEIQPAGGRRMAWSDYARGHAGIIGSDLVAPAP